MTVFEEAELLGIEIEPGDTEETVREAAEQVKWDIPLLAGIAALRQALDCSDHLGVHRLAVQLARLSAPGAAR